MTVGEALALARRAGVDRLDAQWLLADLVGQTRSWLAGHPEALLDAGHDARWLGLVQRLDGGEPLAYLTGEQTFRGLGLRIDARVLVPRSDTEVLVDWALECLGDDSAEPPEVIDLGTGSGAIALAVAAARPDARVLATDLSAAALEVARANGERLGLGVGWHSGHWWSAVGGRRFDLALSNPPYIAVGDPHLPALRHEPAMALTSGADGLDAIRSIVAGGPAHLRPGGRMLIEHGFEQAEAVRALFVRAGYAEVRTRRDAGGRERCTGGRWPA